MHGELARRLDALAAYGAHLLERRPPLRPAQQRDAALHAPVVQRPVVLELERADAVGDGLDRVRKGVREVVHRVDAPAVTGAMVVRETDPVQRRVAQVDVGRGHVDARAQHHAALGVRAGAHLLQQFAALLGRARAVRRVAAGLGQGPAGRAHLLGARLVDIGVPQPHQILRARVQVLEVVGREVQVVLLRIGPVESQPAYRIEDRVDVFLVLARRIGIVETHGQRPWKSRARPKLRKIDLAWPRCR